ncbi:Eukaryotic translation initiation factor eIF-1 [Coemansia sp. RSA 1199]|nr:Eukaryotic translation initiation factor eIF-1 [Coemansia sp. RSA 1199]
MDVDSSDEGTTPQLNYNKDSNSEDSDLDKETKKGKKGKKGKAAVEAFDDIEFSASLNPFGSGAHDPFAEDKKKESNVAAKLIRLPSEFDLKMLVKHFKKTFGCLGTIVDDDDFGKVIQLSGNQCTKLIEFLVGEGIAKKDDIQVHGL